jgi:hypothetical protein
MRGPQDLESVLGHGGAEEVDPGGLTHVEINRRLVTLLFSRTNGSCGRL